MMNAPLATSMAAAFRKAGQAPPAVHPAERAFASLRGNNADLRAPHSDPCVPRTVAGTPEAIEAARAGNLKRVDEIELAWRNAWRILPRVPAVEQLEQHGRGRELMAFSIERGAGPRGEALIEWSWIQPCPRCWRQVPPTAMERAPIAQMVRAVAALLIKTAERMERGK